MKLGRLVLIIFLISFPIGCYAGDKKKQRRGRDHRQQTHLSCATNNMHRSQSAGDCTAEGSSSYIAINSAPASPSGIPRNNRHLAIAIPQPKTTEKPKPQKTCWQRNRVNVAVGLSALSSVMLGVTMWYMSSAVNNAVGKVETQFAPVTKAAVEINTVYNFIQNLTGVGKP